MLQKLYYNFLQNNTLCFHYFSELQFLNKYIPTDFNIQTTYDTDILNMNYLTYTTDEIFLN